MKLRTWFTGVLRAHTALHIGIGTVLSTATDAPIIRGADGRPLIPGSSLKGALRSASERLLRALSRRACVVFGDEPTLEGATPQCLTTDKAGRDLFTKVRNGESLCEAEEEAARRRFAPPNAWGPDPWRSFGQDDERQLHVLNRVLCEACRTWGSPFLAGRVRVPDLRLTSQGGSWSGATEIRDGVGLDRDTGTAVSGIKFDLEVLPAGAEFDFELIVEPEADLAVVALAIGELLQGDIPLGGRVTRGLGEVKLEQFTIHQVDLANPKRLVGYLTHGDRGEAITNDSAMKRLEEMLTTLAEANHAA